MGDLRFAWRSLKKHPGFALVAWLTLAIGIGSATAIFSVLNAVVLRPLPYIDPDRLVIIRDSFVPKLPEFSVSPGRFLEWQARTRAFDGIASSQNVSVNLTGSGDPERLRGALVSANFFEVLGASPLVGTAFAAGDDADPARAGRAVLSEAFWRGRFAAAADIVGRTILLDDKATTIIGVMPATVAFPSNAIQVWLVKQFTPAERRNYGSHYLSVLARMKRAVIVEQAREDLARASREIEQIDEGNRGWTTLFRSRAGGAVRSVLARPICGCPRHRRPHDSARRQGDDDHRSDAGDCHVSVDRDPSVAGEAVHAWRTAQLRQSLSRCVGADETCGER